MSEMFRQLDVPVLGLVENMSYYDLPDGTRDYVFGEGGGQRLAAHMGIPLLAQIPLNGAIQRSGDAGVPAVLSTSDPVLSRAFKAAAAAVVDRIRLLPARPQLDLFKPSLELRIIE